MVGIRIILWTLAKQADAPTGGDSSSAPVFVLPPHSSHKSLPLHPLPPFAPPSPPPVLLPLISIAPYPFPPTYLHSPPLSDYCLHHSALPVMVVHRDVSGGAELVLGAEATPPPITPVRVRWKSDQCDGGAP